MDSDVRGAGGLDRIRALPRTLKDILPEFPGVRSSAGLSPWRRSP